jgi:hypothetical protein
MKRPRHKMNILEMLLLVAAVAVDGKPLQRGLNRI